MVGRLAEDFSETVVNGIGGAIRFSEPRDGISIELIK